MPLVTLDSDIPKLGHNCFVANDSWLIGKVFLGNNVSVFFGSVLRGDIEPISVGNNSNIQEHSLLHTSYGLNPCVIGNNVTVGHRAIIHGCTISDNCIIGMGSIILDNSIIPKNCIVGAGSLVSMNKTFPENSLIMGSPAKVVRTLTEKEILSIQDSADRYVQISKKYR